MCTLEYLSRFLTSLEARGRAVKTVRCYQDRVLRVLGLVSGDVTTEALESAVVQLRRSGLAPASLAGYIQAVKTFYHWAHKRGYIDHDPAAALERPKVQRRATDKAIPQGDMLRMLDYCQANELVMEYAIVMLFADTGCRIGELIGLDVSDVDLTRFEAVCVGKCGERDLYFTEPTAEALRAWLVIRPNTSPALFSVENGRATYTRIYNALERIGRAVHARRWNPHGFRHGVAQAWIDQEANLEVVRIKMGHQDITTTAQIYGNQDRKRIKRATQRYSLVRG